MGTNKKTTRRCTVCRKEKALDATNFNSVSTKVFKGFTYRCKPCDKEREKERYEKRAKKLIKYQKQYREKNPEKVRGRILVAKALKEGVIKKLPCQVCGSVKSQGHHPNYKYPLKVVWLCSTHHQEEHQRLLKVPKE